MYIIGECIHTQLKNDYLPIITDQYKKLTKTVPMKFIDAADVAKHFLNAWVFNYGLPEETHIE